MDKSSIESLLQVDEDLERKLILERAKIINTCYKLGGAELVFKIMGYWWEMFEAVNFYKVGSFDYLAVYFANVYSIEKLRELSDVEWREGF